MMLRTILLAAVAAACMRGEDGWSKVVEIRSGTELRIFRRDVKQPLLAKMDEATDERLSVVVKDRQVAIPRAEVDRVDARPQGGSRVVRESKVTSQMPDAKDVAPAGPAPGKPTGPSTNVSSGLSIGSKPDFETVYRRAIGKPKP